MASLILSSGYRMTPSCSGFGYPVQLLVLVGVLRRAFAYLLRDLGELAPGHVVLDGLDVDLMPPVVAEVEPVPEAVADLQGQRLDGGFIDTAYRRVGLVFLDFQGVRQDVPASLRVHRPLAELELVHVFFPAAIGVEDGVVQVFEGLFAPNLDGAGHHRILLGELLGDWAAEQDDFHRVKPSLGLAGGPAGFPWWVS